MASQSPREQDEVDSHRRKCLCLDAILSYGLVVDWHTIRVGWEGVGCCRRKLVTADEVIKYAQDYWARHPDAECEALRNLACANRTGDDPTISKLLAELAKATDGRYEVAKRKWNFILLAEKLRAFRGDRPDREALELLECWDDLDRPSGISSEFESYIQDGRNLASYEHILKLFQDCREWVERERKHLLEAARAPW